MENINFESDFPVTDKEQKEYIEMAKKLAKKHCEDDNPVIDSVKLTSIGGDKKHCKLSYHTNEEKFERIRRITGLTD